MKKETLDQIRAVYEIESECIRIMSNYFDETAFSKAVDLLKNAEKIVNSDGTTSFVPNKNIFLAAAVVALLLSVIFFMKEDKKKNA